MDYKDTKWKPRSYGFAGIKNGQVIFKLVLDKQLKCWKRFFVLSKLDNKWVTIGYGTIKQSKTLAIKSKSDKPSLGYGNHGMKISVQRPLIMPVLTGSHVH